jgi:pimeloyl-ACP methyl ester carboxylesterase
VVANSYGGLIAMRLAVARPELVRSLNVHEPPGAALLADDPGSAAVLQQLGQNIAQVTAKLEAGEHEAAAKQFADEIAFGPGAWESEMTPDMRAIMVNNAPTFLDETRDPEALGVDVAGLKSFERPFLLTDGDQSPAMFGSVIARVTAAVPNVEHRTIAGVAHVPQITHPNLYADVVSDFADAA